MKKIYLCIGGVVFFAAVSTAQAADQGWYLGGGLGSGQVKFNADDFVLNTNPIFATVSESNDKRKTAYKLFVGYSVNKYFGVEAAYLDLGTYQYRYTDSPAGNSADDVKIKGFNFSLVGTYPVSEGFSLLGKIGAFSSKTTTNTSADAIFNANYGPWPVGSTNANKTKMSLGVGVGYDLNNSLSLRGEYEQFQEVGTADNVANTGTGRVTPSLWSLSAVYKF